MKGIIIAGGMGTRLRPISNCINKHILPIYNKPMIYYSLSLLIQCGCKKIYIVINKKDLNHYQNIIPKKTVKKYKIQFLFQYKADGIYSAISLLNTKLNKNESGVFILGDNFFFSKEIASIVKSCFKKKQNTIFTVSSKKPWLYGVVEKYGKVLKFYEKKKHHYYNCKVISGLYIFKKNSLSLIKKFKMSKRKEYEIIDLIKYLYYKKDLSIFDLGKKVIWHDMGTYEDINVVSNLVKNLENKLGKKIVSLY